MYQNESVLPAFPRGTVEEYLAVIAGQSGVSKPSFPRSTIEQYLNYISDHMKDHKIGRFLSMWNAITGLPATNPTKMPFTYKTGDYFIIGNVSSTTNYKPSGSSYTGTASTTVETEKINSGDLYYYDGSTWLLSQFATDSVKFVQQILTNEQKTQARANIDAVSASQMLEVGTVGQTQPSATLAIGGIFLEREE